MWRRRGHLSNMWKEVKAKLNISSETFSNYRCSNKYYLKRHIVRHTAERQFKCEFEGCGKSFFDQHVLRSHEKIHLGIKDFHCTLCPKQFTQSQQLSVHMKRHNGTKEHACAACGKAFVEPAGARNCKHQKIGGS